VSIPGLFTAVAVTEGITVRVQPRFAADQSDPESGHWVWHYHVRVENGSGMTIQLVDRAWAITDGHGVRRDVVGEGVVGEQPTIPPGGSYDYVSGCPLATPMGHMVGHYGMLDPGGRRFEVAIPPFDLVSPDTKRAAN
jgi:ApaG protein